MKHSASEILEFNIPELPKTKSALLSKAKRENWDYEIVLGKGGKTMMFSLPDRYLAHLNNEDTVKSDNANRYRNYENWFTSLNRQNIIAIPYYPKIRASAGFGSINDDYNEVDVMWFRPSFIKRYLGVNPMDCICIRVDGDSMYPTVKPNSTILVNTSSKYTEEGIYLIRVGNELKVKRLQKIGTHLIRIISDNKELYGTEEIDLSNIENHEFEVIGRAIWTGVLL